MFTNNPEIDMNNIIRTAIAAEAAKHGFTLDYSDLRCGLFFLKRGTEVLSIGRCGRITKAEVANLVDLTVRQGNRIDQIEGSRYFQPLRERLCTPMTVGEAAITASTVL